jgi:hypothetical protein
VEWSFVVAELQNDFFADDEMMDILCFWFMLYLILLASGLCCIFNRIFADGTRTWASSPQQSSASTESRVFTLQMAQLLHPEPMLLLVLLLLLVEVVLVVVVVLVVHPPQQQLPPPPPPPPPL